MIDLLVIGYGNDLRSDDGAGRVVADRIEDMELDGVKVISRSQLTPEMSLDLAGTRRAVFVDASVDATEFAVRPVEPGIAAGVMTHHGDPGTLLALAADEGHVPEATLLEIPASNLEMGFDLSEATSAGVESAVEWIVSRVG
ncbi:MAG: hydrogenase maturation protease [Acidimicrobiia bacterium]|nr:hydrogenase maturation protease [Acidimicrobiia bacterium]